MASFVLFMAANSADFCNKYIRSTPSDVGLVTLGGFMSFWGWAFLATTCYIIAFKQEAGDGATVAGRGGGGGGGGGYSAPGAVPESEMGVVETYKAMWSIVRLPAVMSLILFLMTSKVGFAAVDAVSLRPPPLLIFLCPLSYLSLFHRSTIIRDRL
jgi:MFS transporter, PAT family, solute carrier family 33 (acetyl-CoA transportor), member 1